MKKLFTALLSIMIIAGACSKQEKSDEDLTEKAMGIHERVITLDTHVDFNVDNFTPEKNYTMDLSTQVTLPKMKEGGLDVAWFIVYTGQGPLTEEGYAAAYENADAKFKAIHRLAEEFAPDQIDIALTSDDVRRIAGEGKLVAMIGVENAYPVGTDLSRIEEFYNRGARYMSLAHNGHNQFSDSHTGVEEGEWMHDGLSELGREAIKEMNRLGIMIDISHPSDKANRETIELSKAPVIASHSSARAVSYHTRNLPDDLLQSVKENGGVVQTVALDTYVNREKDSLYSIELEKVYHDVAAENDIDFKPVREIRQMEGEQQEQYFRNYMSVRELAGAQVEELNKTADPVNVADFVDHIDYMVDLIGIDHVGISSDFDGGGGIYGWMDASETFNVTLELLKRGYTEEEISKLWSGNLLRVLDEVQAVAEKIQAGEL